MQPLVPLDWEKTWGAPRHLVVADFNHDGLPDLVVAEAYAIARFTNLGGQFGVPAITRFKGENIPFEIKSGKPTRVKATLKTVGSTAAVN